MKINEIIKEGIYDDPLGDPMPGRRSLPIDDEFEVGPGEMGFGDEREEEMELSSNADTKMINAVRKVCDQYKGQGHAQVELLPFLTKVIEIAKKPVNLADLIAINKKSQEIQSMIDSIDEKKVKFKNMSVKNEDPNKERAAAKAKGQSTVASMASRAMSK